MLRNGVLAGSFALTDARSGIALSTREVFDHLSPLDLLCGFVFWTRGFGDDLARALFPASVWQPFLLDFSGGYYDLGQHRYPGLVQQAMAGLGLSPAEAQARVDHDLMLAILSRPLGYLASFPALVWRGMWIDEYVLLGLPALGAAARWAWRRGEAAWLLVLLPGIFNLLFYPAISLNIPRYQITAVPAMALGAVWLAWRLWPGAELRLRALRARRRVPAEVA